MLSACKEVTAVERVKVSSRYQIAVPSSVRKQLGIEAGDYLHVEVCDGTVILKPEPRQTVDFLRGLHSEVWQGVDPVAYVRQERSAWPESTSS